MAWLKNLYGREYYKKIWYSSKAAIRIRRMNLVAFCVPCIPAAEVLIRAPKRTKIGAGDSKHGGFLRGVVEVLADNDFGHETNAVQAVLLAIGNVKVLSAPKQIRHRRYLCNEVLSAKRNDKA